MINHSLLPPINRLLSKKDKFKRENVGYEHAKLIGILHSHPDQTKASAIQELVDEINKDDKAIVSIFMVDKQQFSNSDIQNSFGEHQIKLFGEWTNPIVTDFCNRKFDYLLYLDDGVSPLTENILLKSAALCRIGFYNESNKDLFEMMIKTANNAALSYQMMEVYKYLKQLR